MVPCAEPGNAAIFPTRKLRRDRLPVPDEKADADGSKPEETCEHGGLEGEQESKADLTPCLTHKITSKNFYILVFSFRICILT